jgi:hypothetical protein
MTMRFIIYGRGIIIIIFLSNIDFEAGVLFGNG